MVLLDGGRGKDKEIVARQHTLQLLVGTSTMDINFFVLACVSLAAKNPLASQITLCVTPQSLC